MPELVQLVPAVAGYNAVIANLVTGKPEFHTIVLWGLVEEEEEIMKGIVDGGPVVETSQGVVPLILDPERKGATLQPAYLCGAFVGIAGPGETQEQWVTATNECLAIRAAQAVEEDNSTQRTWN